MYSSKHIMGEGSKEEDKQAEEVDMLAGIEDISQ